MEIVTDDGISGISEIPGNAAINEALASAGDVIRGMDVFHLNPIRRALEQRYGKDAAGDRGLTPWDQRKLVHIFSAVEVACMDIIGKVTSRPVVDLLGGKMRDAVPFAAYLFYKPEGAGGTLEFGTDSSASGWAAGRQAAAMDPAGIVRQAESMCRYFGFKSIKLKAGVFDPQQETDAIIALHEAFGDDKPLRIDPNNPLDFGRPERPFSREAQTVGFDLVEQLNGLTGVEYPNDPATAARIASYELAFKMQRSVPEVVDFADETEETKKLYGLDLPHCKDFGMQLLAARRFVERGVRFIQIQHGGGGAGAWDAHGGLKANHEKLSLQVDQPIGALLEDLDRRGLLDETIVIFATEFGRTPGSQGSDGRDHHPFAFSVWMAGGGIKGGHVHGATDELGFHAVEHRHYVTDIHATILKQLGLDSRKLDVPGRKRLAIDHGLPIDGIIA